MQLNVKKRVGILRGGTGDYYQTSLKKGGEVIACIQEHLSDDWKIFDILIDKNGLWHINGLPILPADLSNKVDIIWNLAHPSLSQILNNFSIPNASISPFSSVFENNRKMLEEHMKTIGVNMPRSILLPVYQKDFDRPKEKYALKKAKEVFEKLPPPWIVRPLTEDKNMGIHIAKTFKELADAIEDGVSHNKSILAEELITGKVVYMHSIAGFRGEDIYHLPAIEAKGDNEKKSLTELTENIYKHVGATNYLKSNFILNSQKGIYLTSIEFLPDLNKNSHFFKGCARVSAKIEDVFAHILEHTLKNKK